MRSAAVSGGGGGGGLGVVSASTEASIRDAVATYSRRLRESGAPQPWALLEQVGDELLDELLSSCAASFLSAADACVESLVVDEGLPAAPA